MQSTNASKIVEWDEKLANAEENHGEQEVYDAVIGKADIVAAFGTEDEAIAAYEVAMERDYSSGQRIDIQMKMMHAGLFAGNFDFVDILLRKLRPLVEKSGDWDRRNRLKVYEATFALSKRSMKRAADLFLDTTKTFTSYDLMPYNTYIFYTVVTSVVALEREVLKEKVVSNPEILAELVEQPIVAEFLNALYECRYRDFMKALIAIERLMRADRFLVGNASSVVRSMRIKVYAQFLSSYRSVTIDSMARSFGVEQGFLDRELAHFIATGKLQARIDKVGGIVETNQADKRNAQYLDVIKRGDDLLYRVGKLSRIVSK
jgi:26S proteasome regulatory subunit N7